MSGHEKRRIVFYGLYVLTLLALWAFIVWKVTASSEWKWWGHAVALFSFTAIEAVQLASRSIFRPVHLLVTFARMVILTAGVTLAVVAGGIVSWARLGQPFNGWLVFVLVAAGAALGIWAAVAGFVVRADERLARTGPDSAQEHAAR